MIYNKEGEDTEKVSSVLKSTDTKEKAFINIACNDNIEYNERITRICQMEEWEDLLITLIHQTELKIANNIDDASIIAMDLVDRYNTFISIYSDTRKVATT